MRHDNDNDTLTIEEAAAAKQPNAEIEVANDRPLSGWFAAATERGAVFVARVREVVEHVERHRKDSSMNRKRRRRFNDQETFKAMVEALASELAYHVLSDDPHRLAVPRDHSALCSQPKVYRNPVWRPSLPKLLDVMSEAELIDMEIGHHDLAWKVDRDPYRQSTIIEGPRLQHLVEQLGVTLQDFTLSDDKPLVHLRGFKPERDADAPHIEPKGPLLDYDPKDPAVAQIVK